jgi:heme/copper-type cytochrome/quinol oxidase subunit 2
MAFIFSDLVVLPVLRINAAYYGWKMALYILALMLVGIVACSLIMHYALVALDMLPDFSQVKPPGEREFFKVNYQLVLNVVLFAINAVLAWFWWQARRDGGHGHHDHDHGGASLTDRVLQVLSAVAVLWLAGGLLVGATAGAG